MKSRMVLLISALAVSPMALQAQSAAATATSTTTAQAKTPEARIDAAMQAAARAKIPASLIKSKVEEGQAKRVPPQRIATAVEARLEALLEAQQVMKQAKLEARSESDLAVAADAVQAGVSSTALVKMYTDAPRERRAVAVAVLTDLVRLGHASEHALARVSGALSSNVALAQLQAEVGAQVRQAAQAGKGGVGAGVNAGGILRIGN
ncbi:MAG: hypothetical protein ACT443_07620 [Gemmatimonadota bacterium]